MRRVKRLATGLLLALAAGLGADVTRAEALGYCQRAREADAAELSRALQVSTALRELLQREGAAAALLSRSGQDLARFGQRFSHTGILWGGPGRWAVRQLYFSCEARESRLYDEGLAAFVLGSSERGPGWLSMLLLPPADAAALDQHAADDTAALALLGRSYSANAYAFADRHQNCNQWVAEMLAFASGAVAPGGAERRRAQAWLAAAGYEPERIALGSRWLLALPLVVPWLKTDDHPAEDLEAHVLRVSLPASIEAFARRRHGDGARRIELCHDAQRLVMRLGWTPIAAADGACRPEAGDVVHSLMAEASRGADLATAATRLP